jgi:hypothetical protein
MKAVHLFISVVAAAVLGTAASASATPPERFHSIESGTEPGFIHCDGFALDLAGTTTFDDTVFRNRDGQVVRVISRGRVDETVTNSVTGKTLHNRGVFQDFYTRVDGTGEFRHAVSGFDFMATYPGQGVVLQDVGRKVFSLDGVTIIFLAGRHTVPDGPAFEDFICAALS